MMWFAYLYGVATMGSAVIVLFFARYYRTTKDELFIWFALAFAVFGVNWTLLAIGWESEAAHLIYVIRLAGFVMLSVGILRKSRGRATIEPAPADKPPA